MEKQKYIIAYNIAKVDSLDIYLPSAIICELDKNDDLGYMRAAALVSNVESYDIHINGTVHEELFHLVSELNINTLEQNFNKNQKKPKSLHTLFSESTTQKLVQASIDKRMSHFFKLIKENQLACCFEIQRKIKGKDVSIFCYDKPAIPKLQFTKTQTGIRYELKLSIGDELVQLSNYDTQLLTNSPGIFKIKNQIVWLDTINSAKLKPFIKAENIFIPEKHVKTYFEQFILDIMGKVDIEVSGFDLIHKKEITNKRLKLVFDFFKDIWVAELVFDYDEFSFQYSEPNQRKTKIIFGENGSITAYQCIRDSSIESEWIRQLVDIGFQPYDNKKWLAGEGKYGVFDFLCRHQNLVSDLCDLEAPVVDGKEITLSGIQVVHNFELINDWFDLKGSVDINGVKYPIHRFFKNILHNDPFFKLQDGTFFILPQELMSKYSQIAVFGKENETGWRLAKQHFTLVSPFLDQLPSANIKIYEDADVVWTSPNTLKADLRPYQTQGVKWMIKHRLNQMGACLADDMGLGKTLQTIAVLLDAKENVKSTPSTIDSIQLDLFGEVHVTGRSALKAIIILPASLVFNWYAEIRKFAPSLQIIQFIGSNRKKVLPTLHAFDIIITTYQTALLDIDVLKTHTFSYVVLDESQQIRNKNSKVFKALNQLNSANKITLSGTPIENSLSDLWAQMEFINPEILGSYPFFKEKYQIPIEKYRDEGAIKELKLLVDPFILRRTKEQVAPELPELVENIHYVDMSDYQSKYYEKEKSAARNYLLGLDVQSGQFKIHVLATLTKLRQIANHPILCDAHYKYDSAKFEEIKVQVSTIVKSNHKVIIFSSFKSHLALLVDWHKKESIPYVLLTGDTKSEDRAAKVREFQENKETQVFLISIKAGGTGLNLTAADYVFILDPWWNPFIEKQAIARAHRIGQESRVMVTRFISKETLEEKILKLQEKKHIISNDILDINDIPELSVDDIKHLLD